MAVLASSPYLEALRGWGCIAITSGMPGSPRWRPRNWLAGLAVLELGRRDLGGRARALARTPHAFRPLRLMLGPNPIGDKASSPWPAAILSRLTTLSLDRCNLVPRRPGPWRNRPHLHALRLPYTWTTMRSARPVLRPWRSTVGGRLAGLHLNG